MKLSSRPRSPNRSGREPEKHCLRQLIHFRETTIAVRRSVCTALPGDDTPPVLQVRQTVLRFPHINRTLWYRTAALAHHRGHHGPGLQAFLKHASLNANAAGRIRDVPCLIQTYAASREISERAAWKALRAAMDAGWVRCTQKAAPGYTARYELQLPVDLVPNELPEDLARSLQLWAPESLPEPDHTDTRVGHLTLVPSVSTTGPVPDDDEVQTSPSYARALSPLWSSTFPIPGAMSRYEGPPPRRGAPREPIRPDEIEAAREVLARCGSWWSQQRRAGAGSLSAAEVEALLGPVAYALRRATPSELVELMTVQIRSARSLPHVVGARLWKLIRSRTEHYRQRDVPADEASERYSSMLARRARHQDAVTVRTADLRGDLRERIEQQAMDSRLTADPPWQFRRSWDREDEAVHAGERAFADLVRDAPPVEVYRACVERSRRERRADSRGR